MNPTTPATTLASSAMVTWRSTPTLIVSVPEQEDERIGADRRDVNERRAGGLGGERHRLGAFGLHRIEALPAALEQDADQVDDDVSVAHRSRNRLRIAQIGLHRVDLPDPAHRPQEAGELRPAHRDPDTVLPLRQRPHHMAAEEA